MCEIYIARYSDPMYSEDDEIFAAYMNKESAQKRIEEECSYYYNRERRKTYHKANLSYYKVEKTTLI